MTSIFNHTKALGDYYTDFDLFQQIEFDQQQNHSEKVSKMNYDLSLQNQELLDQVSSLKTLVSSLQSQILTQSKQNTDLTTELLEIKDKLSNYEHNRLDPIMDRMTSDTPLSETVFVLQDRLNELNTTIESKDAYIKELESKLSALEDQKSLSPQMEDLVTENSSLQKQVYELSNDLQISKYKESVATSLLALYRQKK